jgi:putative sterol carrier protein
LQGETGIILALNLIISKLINWRLKVAEFPSEAWVKTLMQKLNSDEKYAKVAQKWEGDMLFNIEPDGSLVEPMIFYLDLWHGKCREAYVVNGNMQVTSVFSLSGPYNHYKRLLKGDLEPIQALLTRKLSVKGNMAVLMRNVPTVLDFVRCCREVTDSFV